MCFFKQKTAYEMRISDWSSDVCSSDLDHIRQILDRLRQVRKIGISPDVAGRIHADRFRQYVREGRASPAYMIERYIPSRRRATLVAFLLDLEERLTDNALEMADKLIGSIFTRAKNAQARSYATTSKNVARLMLIFRRTIDALTDAELGRAHV